MPGHQRSAQSGEAALWYCWLGCFKRDPASSRPSGKKAMGLTDIFCSTAIPDPLIAKIAYEIMFLYGGPEFFSAEKREGCVGGGFMPWDYTTGRMNPP